MKHMKKLMLLIVLFTSGFFVQAQDAKKLLNEVSQKVRSYDNISIDFKYALVNKAEDINQETRGDVALMGNKYKLNIMGTTQLYDGKKLHVIIPEDEEINIANQDEDSEGSITPSKMLTFYEEGFNYKWDVTQDIKGRKIQYVKLIPIDTENNEMKEILLGVDSQTKHIYKLIQKQRNGSQITITVQNFKTNQPLSETLFTFDASKYADYYINRID